VINDQPTVGLGSTTIGGDRGPHRFYVFLRSALDTASFKYAGHGHQGDRTISLPRAAPPLAAANTALVRALIIARSFSASAANR
jgi:hypothetical protein